VHLDIMTAKHEKLFEWVAEWNEKALFADGLEEAVIGVCERFGGTPVVAYDRERCIEILAEQFSMRSTQRVLQKAQPRRHREFERPDPFVQPWGEGWPSDSVGIAVAFSLIRVSKTVERPGWWRPTTRELTWAIRLHTLFKIHDIESAFHLWYMARLYADRERASEVFPDQERVGIYDDLDDIVEQEMSSGALGYAPSSKALHEGGGDWVPRYDPTPMIRRPYERETQPSEARAFTWR
jgi:hypothetical protein